VLRHTKYQLDWDVNLDVIRVIDLYKKKYAGGMPIIFSVFSCYLRLAGEITVSKNSAAPLRGVR
jgi:hypothetical protein